MSKKLLPIILVLFVAGAAVAGDLNYTVYGKIHMSMQMVNDGEDSQLTMTSNTSRFGIKGMSEMTDTLDFIWQFESFINPSAVDAKGLLANRNSFVGVKGNFGKFLYGIHDTPFKTLGRKTTFFFDTVGDYRTCTTLAWGRRLSNVALYTLPKMANGLVGQVAYQFDQNAMGAEEAANTISAMGAYTTGQLYIGAAIEMDTKGKWSDDYDNDVSTDDTYTEDAPMGIRVAGKYNADQFGVSALFQTVQNNAGWTDVTHQTMGIEGCFHANETLDIKALFFMADPNTDVDDNEYNLVSVGLDKKFPSKVTAYVQFAMVMNGDASQQGIGGNGFGGTVNPAAAGDSPWALSAGLFKAW